MLNCTGIVLLNVAVVLDTLVVIRHIRFLRIQKRVRRKSDGDHVIEGMYLLALFCSNRSLTENHSVCKYML